MSGKKIIAVTTATGEQGGSVVRELLKDGTFAIRALTRNPSSAKAQELAKQGVEVVKADTGDVASLEKAFEGVYGVYGNTVWTLFAENQYAQQATRDAETQHGKNLVDAAKKNNVQAFVWSTLDKTPTGVYHFVSKFDVGEYLEKSGIPHWTLLYTSCYFTNLTKPGIAILKKNEGGYVIESGAPTDAKIDWYDPGETGYWVVPILKDAPKYTGKRVDAAGELISVRDIAAKIKSLTGITVHVPEVTNEQFFTDEFRKASMDELWLNWATWVRGEVVRDYKQSYDVASEQPSNFERFLKKNRETWEFLGAEYKA